MEQIRTSERRSGSDRRASGTCLYTGPERRKRTHRRNGFDRRLGWPTVCVFCGTVCGTNKGWVQGATTIETTVENQIGICSECSPKKFPQFYSDNWFGSSSHFDPIGSPLAPKAVVKNKGQYPFQWIFLSKFHIMNIACLSSFYILTSTRQYFTWIFKISSALPAFK